MRKRTEVLDLIDPNTGGTMTLPAGPTADTTHKVTGLGLGGANVAADDQRATARKAEYVASVRLYAALIVTTYRNGLQHAHDAGKVLAAAQDSIGQPGGIAKGTWTAFLIECGISSRSASGWMKIFREWETIEAATDGELDLSFNAGMALLKKPKETAPETPATGPATDPAAPTVPPVNPAGPNSVPLPPMVTPNTPAVPTVQPLAPMLPLDTTTGPDAFAIAFELQTALGAITDVTTWSAEMKEGMASRLATLKKEIVRVSKLLK